MKKYIQGLTDNEFSQEYPNFERGSLVALLHSITRGASAQRKKTERV
jgi:hypothetical protein